MSAAEDCFKICKEKNKVLKKRKKISLDKTNRIKKKKRPK